ncbi:MAG TPA: mannose-1-phosphate guanylyltransferase/mannose-6-phosphate isomerase [Usitatibacter sp.]|nr:mannose-1-phosphate guanylyltransferase/mannose-6-phosphate isomerase [Usitatibacter sp.]
MNLYPVILAGGSGTRLWPLSREAYPKQFLPVLDGATSPYQATLERARAIEGARDPIVVTNREHRFLALEQARAARRALRHMYVEPFGRGTAPAAAVVACRLAAEDPDAAMLVMPSDHDIADAGAFAASVATGLRAAAHGRLVVFGIEPRWAETGYGYIERGAPLGQARGCHEVASFVEKPELEIATRLAASGRHSWNSGVFLLGAASYLAELERLEPELARACRAASEACRDDDAGFRHLDETAFGLCRDISVDRAVLERTDRAAVVPAAFAWSDIGSWDALWERGAKDEARNECHGDVQLHGVRGSYVHASHRLVVAIGLEDVVVVETPDALLVARRGETQRVREAVEKLRARGRNEHRIHRRVHRPWGCYEDIDGGERFRVKRITVEPGRKLSLQWHHHRAEHWVVVSGTARVTRGAETLLLTENQSIYIPVGETHRLENPGKVALQLIEVQTGSYLGEDDIVRVDDEWHREREAAR